MVLAIMEALGAGIENDQYTFFGFMGVASALVFASKKPLLNPSDLGAAYGTAKSGVGISSMGVLKPELIFKSIVPIIMAGILGIYGLIVSVILIQKSNSFRLTSQFSLDHTLNI
jgi:ATP synthase proteolipid subunit